MLPIISVIIPVYKVELYLRKCLDSVCNQTYKNLEIILVDDGSPDNCGKICDEYAAKDSRIRVIHKLNEGLSVARNSGIKIATGEYLGFVDSDDYIEPDMYEFLYQNLVKENADISICGLFEHKDNRTICPHDDSIRCVVSGHDAVNTFLPLDTAGNASWNKLYRRHVFSETVFPAGKQWEDSYIMIRLIDQANRVVFDMKPKYHYLRRPGSITMTGYRPGLMDQFYSQTFIFRYAMERYPDLASRAILTSLSASLFLLNLMLITKQPVKKAHKKQIIDFLKKNRKIIFSSPYVSRRRKLKIHLLCIHELFYKIIFYICDAKIYEAAEKRGPLD